MKGEKRRREARRRERGNRGHGEGEREELSVLSGLLSPMKPQHTQVKDSESTFTESQQTLSVKMITTWAWEQDHGKTVGKDQLMLLPGSFPRLAPLLVPLWPPQQTCTPAASKQSFS